MSQKCKNFKKTQYFYLQENEAEGEDDVDDVVGLGQLDQLRLEGHGARTRGHLEVKGQVLRSKLVKIRKIRTDFRESFLFGLKTFVF